jgi:hypothetical protein
MSSAEGPRVVELTDLPPAEPNCQTVNFVCAGGRVRLIYEVNPFLRPPKGTRGADPSFVVVDLGHCYSLATGPNDEALGNHPMAKHGLQAYAIQEVVNSPWIADRVRVLHKDGIIDPRIHAGLRHFVFAFKEGLFECLARGYRVVGTFPTEDDAWQAASAVGRD